PPPSAPPPPRAQSFPPPPRLNITHPPPPRTQPQRPVLHAVPSVAPASYAPPPPSAAPASVSPASIAHAAWAPVSVPPVARSLPPSRPARRRSSGAGGWLLAVAFLAGTSVSLYRNDVLLQVARRLHVEHQFLSAEQRYLGGPQFGTLRALDAFEAP